MTQEEAPTTLESIGKDIQKKWEQEDSELKKVEKKYQAISYIIFKYWILIITIIVTISIFFFELQKRKTLNFDNEYEARKIALVWQYKKEEDKKNEYNQQTDLNIIVKQWFLDISEELIQSYNNLVQYKWYTLPRWTFLYNSNDIKDIEYFNDPNYNIEELEKRINNTISINYSELWTRDTTEISILPLENKSIESTFFVACANQHRLFNWVCNKYIKDFLEGFFVYKVSDDFPWLNKTLKNIMKRKRYKEDVCKWLNNYINYSNSTPNEIEWLFSLCWDTYLDNYNITQSFIELKNDLNDKYIKSNISKYKSINEYKLISYQQILYNNLKNSIPPYEWSYKNYTNYLINILKKTDQDPINSFYYDMTYRFNNQYLIPYLNKIKYQSTQSKRDEIEWIILEIEKINNGNSVEWFIWLKNRLTSNTIEDEAIKFSSNITNEENNNIMNTLLKGVKSLSYLKIINDEITWNYININWYLSLNMINWESLPTPFSSTLEQKNWKLVVKEFNLSLLWYAREINDILKIIIEQKDYSIWEIYEYIQKNIKIYESNNYNITPCIIIQDKLDNLHIWAEILNCNEERINITKGESGNKILYQFKMNNYNINTITVSNIEIQNFINNNLSWINTNATTVANIIPNIVAYQPKATGSGTLVWSNNAIIAIDDLSTYLWAKITDIWEKSWKIAAEFTISNIDFIGIYDTSTKILWPLFLKDVSVETESWTVTEDPIIKNFTLHLIDDNQNEINKFLIEPIGYLYNIDPVTIEKYASELLTNYLESIFHEPDGSTYIKVKETYIK